ncbi:hypothetical protein A3Q56_03190 [Intoshia linei]|uniref:Cadherin domain-containing protein n=1 Tax=Intoshia linei TaxID=1819745 RepID=A0A177B5Z6_9BILA|nr:hypothetical protein A3Q56_03190 [Intoshia linei]
MDSENYLYYTIVEENFQAIYIGNVMRDLKKFDYVNKKSKFLILNHLIDEKLKNVNFTVNYLNGDMHIQNKVDRDDICANAVDCDLCYKIAILPLENMITVNIIIKIMDINDNSPFFIKFKNLTKFYEYSEINHLNKMHSSVYNVSISEKAKPGHLIKLPQVYDIDHPRNGIKEFILLNKGSSNVNPIEIFPFSIVYRKGMVVSSKNVIYKNSENFVKIKNIWLNLTTFLDYEMTQSYEFVIQANDGKYKTNLSIFVKVLDENDNLPIFLTEYDRKKVIDHFNLNKTKNLPISSLYKMLNFSVKKQFEKNYICQRMVKIKENLPINSQIYQFFVVDPDSGRNSDIDYSLEKSDIKNIENFNLDAYGILYNKIVLKYKETKKIEIKIQACNIHSLNFKCSKCSLIIYVIDTNDHKPLITLNTLTKEKSVKIYENEKIGTFISYIEVYDPDDDEFGQVMCRLNEENDSNFKIIKILKNKFSLVTNAILNREKTSMFIIQITCFDNYKKIEKNLSNYTEKSLNIEIIDRNDNAPVLKTNKTHINLQVAENNEKGILLLHFDAIDLDDHKNGQINYILDEESKKSFYCKNDSMYTKITFDREKTSNYTIFLTLQDQATIISERLSTVIEIYIEIIDLDDNLPCFKHNFYTFKIFENLPILKVVGQIKANDVDGAPNNIFTYYLNEKNQFYRNFSNSDAFISLYNLFNSDILDQESKNFAINPKTGQIKSLVTFDEKDDNIYHLVAVVVPDDTFKNYRFGNMDNFHHQLKMSPQCAFVKIIIHIVPNSKKRQTFATKNSDIVNAREIYLDRYKSYYEKYKKLYNMKYIINDKFNKSIFVNVDYRRNKFEQLFQIIPKDVRYQNGTMKFSIIYHKNDTVPIFFVQSQTGLIYSNQNMSLLNGNSYHLKIVINEIGTQIYKSRINVFINVVDRKFKFQYIPKYSTLHQFKYEKVGLILILLSTIVILIIGILIFYLIKCKKYKIFD